MTKAHVIDGKSLALRLTDHLKREIATRKYQRAPGLATVLVGNDQASEIYVANKRRRAEEVGIKSFHYHLPENVSESEVLKLLGQLNAHPEVDGILVQLPLPKHISEKTIIYALDAQKDVDGLHPLNLGFLLRGEPQTVPCTPLGVMEIIRSVNFNLKGKHAVVIGRSNIVGKPVAQLLLQEDATVTICHSKTDNLPEITKLGDVVVAAVGRPKMINRTHLKKGAFVIDVGINRDSNNKLCGDVDFLDVVDIASFITPVPGGVGPLTIAMLLKNTFDNFLRTTA